MSAYMCDKHHLIYLAKFYESRHRPGRMAGQHAYEHLLSENRRSVLYRYSDCTEEDMPGPIGETWELTEREFDGYVWTAFNPVQVIKAAQCYEYQACETPDYGSSEAHKIIEGIIAAAQYMLPGYEDAKWGAPEPYTTRVRTLGGVILEK